jgi:two-component system, chemotaxis family, chemotaxis protein CheY
MTGGEHDPAGRSHGKMVSGNMETREEAQLGAEVPTGTISSEELEFLRRALAEAQAENAALHSEIGALHGEKGLASGQANTPQPSQHEHPSPNSPRSGSESRGVMLIDDSKLMRASLQRIITTFGYEVCGEAENGEFGADLAISLRPAVVILDHTMPGMNGLECARQILARNPETHIIVLTSTIDQKTGMQYAAMGVQDILAKPTQMELLLLALKKRLGPPPKR